jgi:ATP-dependent DNA helicase RecG
LRKEELLSERQILFHATLGVRLSDTQARAFAVACRESEVTVSKLKAVLGLPGAEVIALADSLVTQVLFKPVEPGKRYALADHLRARFDGSDQPSDQVDRRPENLVSAQVHAKPTDLSTAQVARSSQDLSTGQVKPLESLTDSQWKIVLFCDVPRKLTEIMDHLGVVNRGYFKVKHIEPLLKGGVLAMTNPDKPRSSNQRYVITEAGVRLKVARMAWDSEKNEETHGKA